MSENVSARQHGPREGVVCSAALHCAALTAADRTSATAAATPPSHAWPS
eukprot:CAMPEP_0203936822 /NCGR_PEP_ID=MMETSP0359-20131031/74241_1 /ASSEMBLY_ACC=CAM_ASM_000338 /TAXON_ID=268821 /ORGANISM="Scrippsiella Hangoei, Strain SHTV-5" /LENGTH=48 /DNA_ID= /DNA_START= /DNA_END= /DNA_ORIENTATION=